MQTNVCLKFPAIQEGELNEEWYFLDGTLLWMDDSFLVMGEGGETESIHWKGEGDEGDEAEQRAELR